MNGYVPFIIVVGAGRILKRINVKRVL